jgi:uncharacterized protein (DUF58 family)
LNSDFSLHWPSIGWAFGLLILLVTILALGSGNNLLYLIWAVLLATAIVSLGASRSSLARVQVAIRHPSHAFAEESVPYDLTVINRKRLLPAFSIAVAVIERPVLQGPDGSTSAELAYLPIVPAGVSAGLRVERKFAKRGIYAIEGILIGTRFPFGFIEQRRFLEAEGEIAVFPRPQLPEELARRLPLAQGPVESRAKGSGSDLYAIRQYLASDHHHHIDWKATAKTAQLMVREFTREDDWRVTILFDPRVDRETASQPEFEQKFERAVSLAAGLVEHFLDDGAEVRLISGPDAELEKTGFDIGRRHGHAMLRQLARIAPVIVDEEEEDREDDWLAEGAASEQLRILIAARPREMAAHGTQVIGIEEL